LSLARLSSFGQEPTLKAYNEQAEHFEKCKQLIENQNYNLRGNVAFFNIIENLTSVAAKGTHLPPCAAPLVKAKLT